MDLSKETSATNNLSTRSPSSFLGGHMFQTVAGVISTGSRILNRWRTVWRAGGSEQNPGVEETTESNPYEDDISSVATLLREKGGFTPNHHTPVSEALQALLVGASDTISDAYVQDLIDAIQNVAQIPSLSDTQDSKQALLRVLFDMVKKTGKPPKQILLSNIKCPDRRTYGSGKEIDVFRGTFVHQNVALKHFRISGIAESSRKVDLETTFIVEALRWYNLSHEHVLPFLGLADLPDLHGYCMVSPWMKNGNVRQYLDDSVGKGALTGKESVNTVDRLLYEVSLGLAYLHSNGMVHGELHGAHVYIDENARAYLADYGLTPISDEIRGYFSTSLSGGSGAWLAPELFEPERLGLQSSKSTQETDVYSFGILCVELYTRQSPYNGQADWKIAREILKGGRPERPKAPGQEMSDEIWSLVTRCWAGTPRERPTAEQVASELGVVLRV